MAIRLDANGAWSVDDAAERLRALAQHGIELAEQPVGTFEQMVELRSRVDVKIAADESLVSPFDARRARELGACQVAAVKVAKVGGLGAALEIAEVMPSYLSSALEGPVGIAAAAHAVQALRGGTGMRASPTGLRPSGSSREPSASGAWRSGTS